MREKEQQSPTYPLETSVFVSLSPSLFLSLCYTHTLTHRLAFQTSSCYPENGSYQVDCILCWENDWFDYRAIEKSIIGIRELLSHYRFKHIKLKGFHLFCYCASWQAVWCMLVERTGWIIIVMITVTIMMVIIIIEKTSVVHSGGPWPAFKNRTGFMCAKKHFLRWWSTSSSAAKITPGHKAKLQFFFP